MTEQNTIPIHMPDRLGLSFPDRTTMDKVLGWREEKPGEGHFAHLAIFQALLSVTVTPLIKAEPSDANGPAFDPLYACWISGPGLETGRALDALRRLCHKTRAKNRKNITANTVIRTIRQLTGGTRPQKKPHLVKLPKGNGLQGTRYRHGDASMEMHGAVTNRLLPGSKHCPSRLSRAVPLP